MMAEQKTKPTAESVGDFLDRAAGDRRDDCQVVLEMMADATGAEPEMWGESIVGFGRYRYRYESGREGEWMVTGFSPRKNSLSLYVMAGCEAFPDTMGRLGKYRTGKSCLYVKKLSDVDLGVLRELVEKSVERMAEKRVDL